MNSAVAVEEGDSTKVTRALETSQPEERSSGFSEEF